jgi:predicted SprT family Zn-dependent metalloprotease
MTRTEMQVKIEKQVAILWAKYCKIFGISNPMPIIKLNGRLTRTWGYCTYEDNKIDLSVNALTEHWNFMVKDVLPHELAHQLTYIKYPEAINCKPCRHHGSEWQSVMQAIGETPSRFQDVK